MIVEPASDAKYIKRLFSDILNDISVNVTDKDALELARRYGYLPYMVQRYLDMLGLDETIKLLDAFEDYEFKPALLCNDLKIPCSELVNRLTELRFEIRSIPWSKQGYIVVKRPPRPSIGSTHEFLKGFYYVYRDPSSLVPVSVLSPKPDSVVLDMCAAPGGKSAHILIEIKDRGILIVNDISKLRMRKLLANLFRMGFTSYIAITEDGVDLPKKISIKFDYVMLDAPCSAEGAIMFDKSRKTKTSQEDLAKLVLREILLLRSAIELTKPGGRIVYTTCSIAPEENEYVVTKVLELVEERIEIEEPTINVGDPGLTRFRDMSFHSKVSRCIRVWPHRHSMEGYFVCSLRKLSEP